MLLGIGAIFAFTGGLGVCCYNCRWYDKNKNWGKSYGGIWKKDCDCTLSSGIFGIFRAVLALIALILLLVDVKKIVVAILFIITLVLYLGELIPEAILIDDLKYGKETFASNYECDTGSDFYKWLTEDYTRLSTENAPTTVEDVAKVTAIAQFLPASLESGACWEWRSAPVNYGNWQRVSPVGSCVINYKDSTVPTGELTKDSCDDFDIAVVECRGGWSAGSLTSAVKGHCKTYFDRVEEQAKIVLPASEEDKKNQKGEKSKAKRIMNDAIADAALVELVGASLQEIGPEQFVSSLSLANQILLGCQTISFVATLIGVILLFIKGGAKVSSTP